MWKQNLFGFVKQHLQCPSLHLRNLSSLKFLNLSRNALEELPPGLFDGLNWVQVIDLSRNNLRTLNATLFDLESLATLDMSQNKLQDLAPKLFDGLKLNQLYLQSNNLSQLHADTFQGLTFARWDTILDMSHNQSQELHADAFQNLSFGERGILDMSNNQLQVLPPKVFNGTGFFYLRSLRLEGNQLRSLGARPFYWLIRLNELHLQENQLTDLDEDIFECHVWHDRRRRHGGWWRDLSLKRNLLELNLGGNRLTALPNGIFNGFRQLRNLQLQSNQLARLPQQLFQTLGEVEWTFTEFPREFVMKDSYHTS